MASWRNVDQAGDAFDEAARGSKRGARGLLGYVRTGTGFIVGNRFELIALGKKGAQFISDAHVVSGKPSKLALNGRMSFIDTAGRLEDESLCGMERGEVGRSSSRFNQIYTQHGLGLVEERTRFVEVGR